MRKFSQLKGSKFMEAAYVLILSSEEKSSTVDPTIIGPFANQAEAEKFCEENKVVIERLMWINRNTFGGWPQCHIISPESAEKPEAWAKEWNEWLEDLCDEGEDNE